MHRCRDQQEAEAERRAQQGVISFEPDPLWGPSPFHVHEEGGSCLCRGPQLCLVLVRLSEQDGCDHEAPFLAHQPLRDPGHRDPKDCCHESDSVRTPSRAKGEMMVGREHEEAVALRVGIEDDVG